MASVFLLYSIRSRALSSMSLITTLSAGVLVQLTSYSFLYGCQKRVCLLALMIILGLCCVFGLPGSTWWVWLHLFLLHYMILFFNSRRIDKLRIKYILSMARMKCVLNDYLCFCKDQCKNSWFTSNQSLLFLHPLHQLFHLLPQLQGSLVSLP